MLQRSGFIGITTALLMAGAVFAITALKNSTVRADLTGFWSSAPSSQSNVPPPQDLGADGWYCCDDAFRESSDRTCRRVTDRRTCGSSPGFRSPTACASACMDLFGFCVGHVINDYEPGTLFRRGECVLNDDSVFVRASHAHDSFSVAVALMETADLGLDDEWKQDRFVGLGVSDRDEELRLMNVVADDINTLIGLALIADDFYSDEIQQIVSSTSARVGRISASFPNLTTELQTRVRTRLYGDYFRGFNTPIRPVVGDRNRSFRILLDISNGVWRLRLVSP
jgi:hypothetical protein